MDFANSLEGGVIFCGDLNMTSWSPAFKHYQAQGELDDTRGGYGVQPTWPTWMPLLLVPLDHIWVSKEIRVHNREIGPRVGSDHRPVMLDFSLLNRE
jgi:endonuclease/exonuclease/phosphatase (EEP) superfamily protein YafD